MRFIRGMVKVPVVTTLETEEPLMLPMRPEATTEVRAGPPLRRPVRAKASWMKKLPAPSLSKKAPKIMNTTTKVADTAMGMPNTPSVVHTK